ncbi:MAG: NADH-quinone oxidoreductase subunit N [Verrucomicrobiota bacterium]
MTLEIAVVILGLLVLAADLWLPLAHKRGLGYAAAAALAVLLAGTFLANGPGSVTGSMAGGVFVQDAFALFFKRFFLAAAILALVNAVEFSDRIESGFPEYCGLILFALSGMLFAASAGNFAMLFVSLELITVTFYVLTSFQRRNRLSLEAGVKYLIQGALSSGILVFGIALVAGTAGSFSFSEIAASWDRVSGSKLFQLGALMVLVGLGFKIAMVPFQLWVPDVYQGAPTPTTAFLAAGSKAAGFALLLRLLFTAMPELAARWQNVWIVLCALTILYGNLCALFQRNVKRLLGYSSIAHAGYLLLGVAAMAGGGNAGGSALLYYLAGYVFTVMAAFLIVTVALRHLDSEDVSGLSGLGQRSPLLAAALAVALVSLAGLPPLAGFFGKFLLLGAVVEHAPSNHGFYCLAVTAVVGVVISIFYYFRVIRAMYWDESPAEAPRICISTPALLALGCCVAAILWLGLFPGPVLRLAAAAIAALR